MKDYGFVAKLISIESNDGVTTIIGQVESAVDVVAEVDENLTGYMTIFVSNVIAEVSIDMARVGSPGYGGMMESSTDAQAAMAPAADAIGGPFGWNTFSAQ